MKLNRLTLEFSGESSHLEEPFLNYYHKVYFPQIRILVFLACFMYTIFGVMDVLLIPEQTFNIFFISIGIIAPSVVFTAFFLISSTEFFKKHMQPILAFLSMFAGSGALSMIATSSESVSYFYYAGLMLIFMWSYTVLRLFFIWASVAGWILVLLYAIFDPMITHPPMTIYINNIFFFIGANLIGMMACYMIEFNTRRDFFITQQLELERKNINKINQELEDRVKKRTDDYKIINLELEQEIAKHKKAEEELQQILNSLRKSIGTTIRVMVSAVEARDPYTAGHQHRSADLARAIASEMGLLKHNIDGIRMAASIHDIGKLSVPSEILSKPTKLTDIEFTLIKEHSRSGYEILKDVESPWPLAQIVYQHHERIDGSGYPRNLKGDEIIIEARIMAVADVVEAMASHRPYRPALGIEAALEEIEKNKGILYDKNVVDACLRLFRKRNYHLP
ncbi:MAG: HD-GYP domain-containing protein [Syntrophaceae bacterium]|nr:HD-GYP domain-containing protein [Syntrophaceae bacterium]